MSHVHYSRPHDGARPQQSPSQSSLSPALTDQSTGPCPSFGRCDAGMSNGRVAGRCLARVPEAVRVPQLFPIRPAVVIAVDSAEIIRPSVACSSEVKTKRIAGSRAFAGPHLWPSAQNSSAPTAAQGRRQSRQAARGSNAPGSRPPRSRGGSIGPESGTRRDAMHGTVLHWSWRGVECVRQLAKHADDAKAEAAAATAQARCSAARVAGHGVVRASPHAA